MSESAKPYAGDPECPACHGQWKPGDCSYCFCDHGVAAHDACEECNLVTELFDGGCAPELTYLPLREAAAAKRKRYAPRRKP